MKRKLLFIAMALAGFGEAHAVCFVDGKATGANDGTTWNNAYTDLNSAVKSTACDEIWVAEGVYKDMPTISGDGSQSFLLRAGVALYGGFAGTESALGERELSMHKSVISGDLDNNDAHAASDQIDETAADINGYNSLNLITLYGAITGSPILSSTIVDGFTLTGAVYSAMVCDGSYSSNECSPTLRNLTFVGNESIEHGAAIYITASYSGAARPTISNSTFTGNSSVDGGAIFVKSKNGGASDLSLDNVVFDGNVATHRGGAIYVDADVDGGQNTLKIENARFSNNSSSAGGGAIYAEINDSGILELDVTASTFDSNSGLFGGAIYASTNGALLVGKFGNSTFDENSAVYAGGAISLNNQFAPAASMHTFNNVTFNANRVSGEGMVDGTGGAIDIYTYPAAAGAGVSVTNTILSGDLASSPKDGSEIHNGYGYSVVTIDHSIVAGSCPDASTCTNVSSADPLLGPLGYFFSRTPVMRPGIGGSAIDAGDDATCEVTDQRGFARPQGAHCDIGAVEMRLPSDDLSYPGGF